MSVMGKLSEPRLALFRSWLAERGAELMAPTNPYEVLRFKAGSETHVIYRRDSGQWNASEDAQKVVTAFRTGGAWRAPLKRVRSNGKVRARYLALVERDTSACFYCGKHVDEAEASPEHLFSVSLGGTNHIANIVLTHKRCNQDAGNLSVAEKVRLRDRIRTEVSA
ncbi:HNH endonuclease [Hydrocarboniphaga effusa]|uniref:HNH endonuclease n=1 Tax=Hydrocarboniphaga effusa TaxID=243629 RepID=UPI00398C044E